MSSLCIAYRLKPVTVFEHDKKSENSYRSL